MAISKFIGFLVAVVAASTLQATTTLQFSVSPNGATGFSNTAGVATDGMLWGILIDSGGNGFNQGSYDAFNSGASGFLSVGGTLTDDYYFFTSTATSTLGAPFFAGVEAGAGGITSVSGVPSTGDGITGVAGSDPFGLIWFESSNALAGSKYGFFTTGTFLLPASGVSNFSSVFAGADPNRSTTFTFSAVPEPSVCVLGMFGVAVVVFRRRRRSVESGAQV